MTELSDSRAASDRRQPMRHDDWMRAAELEYRRLLDLFAGMSETDWSRPTDCSEWNVGQVLAHLVGAAESTASLRELFRQQRLGRRYRRGVDGMNDVQVHDRADADPAQLVADLATAAERGVHRRRRIPAPARALRMPFGPPLGVRSVGYLMDRIYTRDAWMHRIDVARATGQTLVLTPEHDGRLIADLVDEWAAIHHRPYDLTLAGPAGGHWSTHPERAQPILLDAIQFARIMAGRADGTGPLNHHVPF